MIKPTLNGRVLAQSGAFTIAGSSQADVAIVPRSIGVLITPSGVIEKNITLNGKWTFPNTTGLDAIENYQHQLNEFLASAGRQTLVVEGISIPNCSVKGCKFDAVLNRTLRYTMDFSIGVQNIYSDFGVTTYNQLSGYPLLKGYRSGYFKPNELGSTDVMENFYFGQQVEQLKSFSMEVAGKKEAAYSFETNGIASGGTETIMVNGWITGALQREILTFMYNAIHGPLGKMGTLRIGTDETEHAFFQAITMDQIKSGSVFWNATFISSVKC